jgi:PAS domain S-box-containing protein
MKTSRDTARISAELTRFTHGNDPFAEAVRATRMPMIITNPRAPDNPVVFANGAFCRLTGYTRAEIIGRNCRFLQGKQTDPVAIARIRDAVREARSIEIDIRNHRKDGEPFWNRLLMAPVYDASGELAYFFASQVDVTIERERLAGLETHNAALLAELSGRLHAQKVSEARLRFAAQAGRMGIWELDFASGELTSSPEAREIFGYDRDAPLTYESKLAAIHPDDRAMRDAALQHALDHGSDYDVEYRVRRVDGTYSWVQLRAQLVRSPEGEAIRLAGVAIDVTERRHAEMRLQKSEDELRAANDMLEQRITAALAERAKIEEALRQAQKMEAVGQLTGGIAHDFNNLLAGIMGSLEFLQKRLEAGRTDGLSRYTAAAMTSAQRATALTQRLLAFARRQPLDPKRVDVNRLVAAMEDLLRRTLGPAINLEMVLAGGLWPTLSDPNQLDSAILNLAINARDAMPHGGRLTIETANTYLDDAYVRAQGAELRAGQYVTVAVTDSGTGMTPDIIAKAFDPFFTTKPTGQGTGLGLSMVYGFVRQSEGHVTIYSEPGQGTTFRLYLPRYRGDLAETVEATFDSDGLQADPGETVLVVDDEATVRMLVTETLDELGYAALEAMDGQAGLTILQSNARVDLLVTDVGLPGLNGRQLADAARVVRPHLKILFMTGYAHNAAVGNGAKLELGMEIITKPFALDALAKKIREMIEG